MSPDPQGSVSRELLEEIIEEGTQAFGSVLEKLFNAAMEVERSQFVGAEPYERTNERRGYSN